MADSDRPQTPVPPTTGYVSPVIERNVLTYARLPFFVCAAALAALIGLTIASAVVPSSLFGPYFSSSEVGPFGKFLAHYTIHILLFFIAVVSALVGYRIVMASGAAPVQVIPQQDYPLLAPLVEAGNTNAIDQYVRLSSLSGFTGTFTQLGLTGLPLATIFLTLLFSALTLVDAQNFLDLTKLTLGAFIGSFVQRQVERRSEDGRTTGESQTPRSAA